MQFLFLLLRPKVKGLKTRKVKNVLKSTKPNGNIKKDKPQGECHHCENDGHWKRNCKVYLATLKDKKSNKASTFGMFMIEIYHSTSSTFS